MKWAETELRPYCGGIGGVAPIIKNYPLAPSQDIVPSVYRRGEGAGGEGAKNILFD
jgi:hypothetical protein